MDITTATPLINSTAIVIIPSAGWDCKFFNFIVWGCLVMAMCYFGYIGNLLSFLALQRDVRSPAVTLLQSLAISDVVLLLSVNITDAIPYVCDYSELCPNLWLTWPYIRYIWLLTPVGHMCSIWLVVLVAANRYWAVCRPHSAGQAWSNPRTYVYVSIVVCFALVCNIPRLFEYEVVEVQEQRIVDPVDLSIVSSENSETILHDDKNKNTNLSHQFPEFNKTIKKEQKTSFGNSPLYKVGFKVIVVNISLIIFPLLFIFFTSVWIIRSLKSSERLRSNKQRTPSNKESLLESKTDCHKINHSKEVTFLLVAVVLVAVACQTPLAAFHFVRYIFSYGCGDVVYFLESGSKLLVTLNSCINFIVYCVLSPKFRRLLKSLITCKKQPPPSSKKTSCLPDPGSRRPQTNNFPLGESRRTTLDDAELDEAANLITRQ